MVLHYYGTCTYLHIASLTFNVSMHKNMSCNLRKKDLILLMVVTYITRKFDGAQIFISSFPITFLIYISFHSFSGLSFPSPHCPTIIPFHLPLFLSFKFINSIFRKFINFVLYILPSFLSWLFPIHLYVRTILIPLHS